MLRTTILIAALLGLAACADPLAQVPRLGEVDVEAPALVVEAVAAPAEADTSTGFFQRILRQREVGPAEPAQTPAPAPEATAEASAANPDPTVSTVAQPTRQRGFLGLFRSAPAPAPDGTPEEPKVEQAALNQPQAARAREQQATRPRRGLFGTAAPARRTGADMRDAQPGEVLPFGQIARACHVKRGALGREVAKYPERGAKYRVYDSAPGNLGLHTFYITGFSDGCPRQVTAALAVFGSARMYETLRYGLPVKARSAKPTDKAYEKLKSRVCGVARSKPCGNRLSRLEKGTVFLSVYNRFEGANGWVNLLLSDGQVMAKDVQG